MHIAIPWLLQRFLRITNDRLVKEVKVVLEIAGRSEASVQVACLVRWGVFGKAGKYFSRYDCSHVW